MAQPDDDAALPKPARKKEEAELDMTAMIDVTFLLLAFLGVGSKMDPQASMKLPQANMNDAVADKNAVVLLMIAGDETGKSYSVYKGTTKDDAMTIPVEDSEVLEEEVGDFVEGEFSQYPTKRAVLIKAEGNVRTGAVESVKRGVARSALAQEKEIHIAVQEK